MKKTIAIIGGSQEITYRKIAKKYGCDLKFHNGKSRNGGNKKEFKNVIKKADCVCVQLGAIGHVATEMVRDLCKEMDIELVFHNGFGASGAVQLCVEKLSEAQKVAA
ncbi:DUF2325 domain-containing protein [Bacillus sp. AFS040349]|uniref:DUF2325 domain-containing protein n=1 Tax=Bacillus sp. AFS040349 TaxID=2033502 RepID=UPI000BFDDADC|nr:DUF2325 domain-containing protein [Bacillus sp. AFS040349]PGT83272.1 DUF2325 domain-containing protein [Bacillus sp. AFS040349]